METPPIFKFSLIKLVKENLSDVVIIALFVIAMKKDSQADELREQQHLEDKEEIKFLKSELTKKNEIIQLLKDPNIKQLDIDSNIITKDESVR